MQIVDYILMFGALVLVNLGTLLMIKNVFKGGNGE